MAYYTIIIYGDQVPEQAAGAGIHEYAQAKDRRQGDKIHIMYYGLCVKGRDKAGDSAVGRMGTVVKVDAGSPQEVVRALQDSPSGGWNWMIRYAQDAGNFDQRPLWYGWQSSEAAVPAMVKRLGESKGIACLYKMGEQDAQGRQSRVFTYGDKASTVRQFNSELRRDVAAAFKDMSGTGVPAEFQVGPDSVSVEALPDGKTRLCFAVHMNASKKDFSDVRLQTRLNELRRDISAKYGVDVDVVDIRSTIEYS